MNDDNKSNIATPQSLPADFNQQAKADEQRHKEADENDQSGELNRLGENEDNEPMDIDEDKKILEEVD